jgi:hypothetical protein
MRSRVLCAFAFALIACSSASTGQISSGVGGGDPSNPNGHGKGGGGAGGGDSVNTACTYTQGYWKNHASAWPVKSLTIGGVSYSEQQLLDLFDTAPTGDASIILAHQLIAALLNQANGAPASAAVQQAINEAQAWMVANRGSNAGLPYAVDAASAAGQQATALTQTLDDFNSGLAGTPHCGSGSSSGDGGGGNGSSSGSGSGCGDGVMSCSTDSQCNEGSQCIEGCCVRTPPPPPPPPTLPDSGQPLP